MDAGSTVAIGYDGTTEGWLHPHFVADIPKCWTLIPGHVFA